MPSDNVKTKISFDEMSFYYDMVIRNAVDSLFNNNTEHGWTLEEFDKLNIDRAVQNAINPEERIYH